MTILSACAASPVGESIVHDPVTKSLRISHLGFRTYTNNVVYNSNNRRTATGDGFTEWGAPLSVPIGATIKLARFRGMSGDAANELRCEILRLSDSGDSHLIAAGAIHTAATITHTSPEFSEVVESGYTYQVRIYTSYDTGSWPEFEWFEIEYLASNYRQTL